MTSNIASKRLGFFTRLLDDVPAGERYRLAAEQIIHAEENGFDSAWIAQHHFHADEGGLPSPAVFLAHVAARTSRIRLGTGVITLPMENPIRAAEDTAVLDLLSNGRLEVGFGTGGTRESFEAFGIDSDRRGEVYADNLAIVRDAWAGKAFKGGNVLYPDAPHLLDRVWLATFSANGARLAGLSGDGLMLSRTQPRPPTLPMQRWTKSRTRSSTPIFQVCRPAVRPAFWDRAACSSQMTATTLWLLRRRACAGSPTGLRKPATALRAIR